MTNNISKYLSMMIGCLLSDGLYSSSVCSVTIICVYCFIFVNNGGNVCIGLGEFSSLLFEFMKHMGI